MARRLRCTGCGCENSARAEVCWFCGQADMAGNAVASGVANTAAIEAMPVETPWAVRSSLRPMSVVNRATPGLELGVATLSIAAVGMCGGAFWIAKGLGLTVTLLVAPAFVQTMRAIRHEESRGRTVSIVAKTGTFVRSLLLGVAARAAWLATFLVITMIGVMAGRILAEMIGREWIMMVCGAMSASIGAVFGFWVALKINRQRVTV